MRRLLTQTRFASRASNVPQRKVQTVLGAIQPEELGRTLMHEHLRVDYSPNFKQGDLPGAPYLSAEEEKSIWESPLTVEDCAVCCCYFSQKKDNMTLMDMDDVVEDALRFKNAGGGAIVECSIEGIRANNHEASLVAISERTGLHVVMGTGYYLDRTHPPGMSRRSLAQLREQFVSDVMEGTEVELGEGRPNMHVRAGFIGELGCTTNLTANEEKVLRAAAGAACETGVAVSIHPGYSAESPHAILDVLESEGLALDRVVMGHVDRGLLDDKQLAALAERGCVLEFDQFGWPSSFQHAIHYGIDYPSDFERCKTMKRLIDAGFLAKLVVSHDIAFKTRLNKFGGNTYDHISRNIVPYMLKRGFTDDDIHAIFVSNPAEILAMPVCEGRRPRSATTHSIAGNIMGGQQRGFHTMPARHASNCGGQTMQGRCSVHTQTMQSQGQSLSMPKTLQRQTVELQASRQINGMNLRPAAASRMKDLSRPTVWTEFSPLAVEKGAVNLGQGFPDWAAPRFAKECIQTAVENDINQYTRPWGHMNLCKALAEHYSESFGRALDPLNNITISNGCSGGLHMGFLSTLDPGDEVFILDPAMDIYTPQVQLAGGKTVHVPLHFRPDNSDPDAMLTSASWVLDLDALESAILQCRSPRLLILNTPHNPTGKMFTRTELEALAALVEKYHLLVFSDEVYEALYFDGAEHVRFATLPRMWERTLTFSSAAKTFSVTGWKCGWVIGPQDLISNVASVGQWSQFCVNAPTQEAVANMLHEAAKPYLGHNNYYDWLRDEYARKRSLMQQHLLESTVLRPIMPEGGFFILADTSDVEVPKKYLEQSTEACPEMTRDWAFCRWLTEEVKVAAIPPSAFCSKQNLPLVANFARFAFCKLDDALLEAGRRLGAEPLLMKPPCAGKRDTPVLDQFHGEEEPRLFWHTERDEPGPKDDVKLLSTETPLVPDPRIYKRPAENFYTFSSGQLDFRSTYRLLCSTVVPRPIAWLSTMSSTGVPNLAPVSFYMPVTSKPASIAFSMTVRSNDTEKDTLNNIRATGEFVVNHVSVSSFQKMYESSHDFPPEVDEFTACDVTPVESLLVRPFRILESPVQMECKLLHLLKVGDGKYGSCTVVVGEVLRWHVKEQCLEVVEGRVNLDANRLQTLARLGGLNYMQLTPNTFSKNQSTWNETHW